MKGLGLVAALTMVACGGRGPAKSAEVELQWPDASTSPATTMPIVDAGALAPVLANEADAMPALEVPQ